MKRQSRATRASRNIEHMADDSVMDGTGKRTPEQVRQFAKTLVSGGSLKDANLAAGYSEHVANQGVAKKPAALRSLADTWARAQELMELGKKMDTETVSTLIKGRLTDAMAHADDSVAVQAAHRLGTHKDYNLFAAESQIGVAVYQVSPRLEQLAAQLASQELPTIDADQTPDTPSDVTKE